MPSHKVLCNRESHPPIRSRRTHTTPTPLSTSNSSPSRGLNITLWVLQVLLAAIFLMAGGFKLVTPANELAA